MEKKQASAFCKTIAVLLSVLVGGWSVLAVYAQQKCHTLTTGNGGDSGRNNLSHADSCIGASPCEKSCYLYFSSSDGTPLPNGQYCLRCRGESCGCTKTGEMPCWTLVGTCTVGSGPDGDGGSDPCYCRPDPAMPPAVPPPAVQSDVDLCGGAS
jgi:hypothetical protein